MERLARRKGDYPSVGFAQRRKLSLSGVSPAELSPTASNHNVSLEQSACERQPQARWERSKEILLARRARHDRVHENEVPRQLDAPDSPLAARACSKPSISQSTTGRVPIICSATGTTLGFLTGDSSLLQSAHSSKRPCRRVPPT